MAGIKSPIAKLVDGICRHTHRNRHDIFRLLLELSYCALAQRGPGASQKVDELEARYMRAIKPFAEDEVRHEFPRFLTQVGVEVNKGGCDPLGEAAGELELLDGHLGQFFTPYHVSRLTAAMTMRGLGYFVEEQGYLTLCEPACGAGSMVLAAAEFVEAEGHDVGECMLVDATDLSEMCYQMAYVQLAMRGVAGIVRRANTLTAEVFEWAWLPATAGFYRKHGRLFEKATPPPRHRSRRPPIRHRARSAA